MSYVVFRLQQPLESATTPNMTGSRQFVLPDLTTIVPFPWSLNPHHAKAKAESSAWVNSFSIPNGEVPERYMIELLASYMFPYAGFEELRTCADFINMITSMDDSSDIQIGEASRRSSDMFLLAISGKPAAQETSLYRMVSEFRERFARKAGPNSMHRFAEHYEQFCAALAKEGELRERMSTLDIEALMKLRREGSAVQPCIGLIEYIHGTDLPDAVFEDETFLRVYWAGIDMLCLSNDLYSFNREQAKGVAASNIITGLMKEKGFSLQQAADFIGEEHKRLVTQFTDASARMPQFGAGIDEDVQKYIHSMEQVVSGNIIWCLETPRYFGVWKEPLQRERFVELWDVEG